MMIIRNATPADAKAILGIYASYITGTCISFMTEVPTDKESAARIGGIVKQ